MTVNFLFIGSIDTYTANGDDGSSPTSIARNSAINVALVSGDESNIDVKLPDDAKVGDIVELHCVTGQTMKAYPASGDSLVPSSSFLFFEASRTVRKISSTEWVFVA